MPSYSTRKSASNIVRNVRLKIVVEGGNSDVRRAWFVVWLVVEAAVTYIDRWVLKRKATRTGNRYSYEYSYNSSVDVFQNLIKSELVNMKHCPTIVHLTSSQYKKHKKAALIQNASIWIKSPCKTSFRYKPISPPRNKTSNSNGNSSRHSIGWI
jgi:hypothetical protein